METVWPPVPPLWRGETVVVFASGPSLTQEQVDAVKGRCRTIAINLAYRLAPWADLLYACDVKWWEQYKPQFAGIKVTQDAQVSRPDVRRVPSVNSPGLSLDPSRIHQGANGGYQALGLAALMGAKKVIFLGFDMKSTDAKKHFHADHPGGMSNPYDGLFQQWIKNFETTKADLQKMGVTVLNATPGSALTAFPLMDLQDALEFEC